MCLISIIVLISIILIAAELWAHAGLIIATAAAIVIAKAITQCEEPDPDAPVDWRDDEPVDPT